MTSDLSAQDLAVLAEAVRRLERPNVAAKALTATGGPTDRAFGALAEVAGGDVKKLVKAGIRQCLDLAFSPLVRRRKPRNFDQLTVAVSGLTGGLGGIFGLVAIPVELPLTTILTIRAIAAIASREGEDLSRREAWLACMEVFSLAGLSQVKSEHDRYYRTRASLARMSDKAAAPLLDASVADASVLVLLRIMGEVFGRTMLILTDVTAASAFPFVGFGIGATLNVILMDHFQKIARSHFAIRRLERQHGYETVQRHYLKLAAQLNAPEAQPRALALPA